jgi:hypothetical protein
MDSYISGECMSENPTNFHFKSVKYREIQYKPKTGEEKHLARKHPLARRRGGRERLRLTFKSRLDKTNMVLAVVVLTIAVPFRYKMHDELVTARGPPQITAAVVPTHTVKSETEPLLQQEARYYQSVPEVAIHFSTPSSEPCPQVDSQNGRPTLKKENQKVEGANWFGIFLAFLSGAFFTLSSAGVKGLTSVDPMELLVLRSLLQIAAMLSVAIRNGEDLLGPKGQRGLLQLQVKEI